MEVPGGKAAIGRFLGYVRQDDTVFASSFNRVLLSSVRRDHDWEQVDNRRDVVQYLRHLEKVRRRLSSRIEVGLASREDRKRFQVLAELTGYNTKLKRGKLRLMPKEGEAAAFERRVAQALGWDLQEIAAEISGGGGRVLTIQDDVVPLPLPDDQLRSLLDSAVDTRDLVETFAKDQRLSLAVSGLGQVTTETRSILGEAGLRWIYKEVPIRFYRYGMSLEVRDGALLVPGGEEAVPIWTSLAGESPRHLVAFIRRLLTHGNGRLAYLWKAMRFAPPEVVKYYLGTGTAGASDDHRFVRRLRNRLDNSATMDFDGGLDEEWGFPALVSSLPLDGMSFRLPGGGGLWYLAAKGDDMPATRAGLERLAERGVKASLEDGEFLLRALSEHVHVGGYRRPVLPRLIQSANVVLDRSDLLTPANVVAITRAVDNYPASLSLLHTFPFEDAETITSYLLAVAHLESLGEGVGQEILITIFQGGTEWLGLMATASRVDRAWLEGMLRKWCDLHQRFEDPYQAAPRHLDWLDSFLAGLPGAGDDRPGRGPLEAAWIQAMTGPRDPQRFKWAGLDYEGHRGARLADAMVVNLERQAIPSVDQLVGFSRDLDEMNDAARQGDVERAQQLAASLADQLRALPEVRLPAIDKNGALQQRILPVDRGRIADLVERFRRQSKAKRLERMAESTSEIAKLTARELRQVFLAPVYLTAMADQGNPLFDDPNLIRKHLLNEEMEGVSRGENRWKRGSVTTLEDAAAGSQVVGHVSSVPLALAEFSVSSSSGTHARGLSTLQRDRAWLEDMLTTPWHHVTPDVTRMVAFLVDTGREVADAAVESIRSGQCGWACELAAAYVPMARLAAFAHAPGTEPGISESERLLLGLALLEDRGTGPMRASEERYPVFEGLKKALGPNWRERLNVLGATTFNLNGRARRWVGYWPPYEALDRQAVYYSLWERELIDLRVWLFAALGENGLPGEMGIDIMRMLLDDVTTELKLESFKDWSSHVRWVNQRDHAYFEEKVRQCLSSGLYTLQSF